MPLANDDPEPQYGSNNEPEFMFISLSNLIPIFGNIVAGYVHKLGK